MLGAQLVILLFSAWTCRGLIHLYFYSATKISAATGAALIVWWIPLLIGVGYQIYQSVKGQEVVVTTPWASVIGLGLSMTGVLVSMNFLCQVGLTFAALGIFPISSFSLAWWAGSASWIYASRWISFRLIGMEHDASMRITLTLLWVVCAAFLFWRSNQNTKQKLDSQADAGSTT